MDVHADMRRHEAALRAVQKPPAKPWRGTATGTTAAPPPPPPKVYRVEPREFRDLVQRLTGAPPTAARNQMPPPVVLPQQPVPVRAAASGDQHQQQQQVYAAAPWFAFPMDHGNSASCS